MKYAMKVDGLRLGKPTKPTKARSVRAIAKAIAGKHGVVYKRTYADSWADNVTRLAGDNIVRDTTNDLLVALKRAGAITGSQMVEMLTRHLTEKPKFRVRPIR